MRFVSARIEGFGRLSGRRVRFEPGINVIVGPNEAGKSTLTTALVASLYGCGRKEQRDAWRPWDGARFAAALAYELEDGRAFEVQRDFEREPKGVRVFDGAGNDVSGDLAVGKLVSPGLAHLGVPLEVFASASCVAQGAVEIDGARAERISAALAQALDGGPREDAALGAMERLDAALRRHVGTERATVNAPLRKLATEIDESSERAERARTALHALEETRGRLRLETRSAGELDAALVEHRRRGRALRAFSLRTRLQQLHEIRDDLAALQAERTQFDDEGDGGAASGRAGVLERLYRDWSVAEALAAEAERESANGRLQPALAAELNERARDGGTIGDAAFAELEAAAQRASDARAKVTFSLNEVQGSRRRLEGGSEIFGALLASCALVLVATAVLATFHLWIFAIVAGVFGLVLGFAAGQRVDARRSAAAALRSMQDAADRAVEAERSAAETVGSALEPLGLASIDELAARRARYRELVATRERGTRLRERAENAHRREAQSAAAFDALAFELVPERGATRALDLAMAKARDSRRAARDGVDMQLSFLEVRRTDTLGDDDEFALERELDELIAAGVTPGALDSAPSLRAFEAEGADLERRARDARVATASSAAELRTTEATIDDVAALDERVETLREQARALEAFGAAVELAMATIDERTREAHQRFAGRLADYSSRTMSEVTDGRYTELRVDPTTLELNARVPETGAFEKIERLSAGTREQAYLVVRLAMVRMFSEGLERPPLILDDPFAFWDDARIARALPVLDVAAADGQVLLFTTSAALAGALEARGAHRIEIAALEPPATPNGELRLHG